MDGIVKLLETMKKLRDPDTGCPWDLQQDHHSLMPYFHEELSEFEEALNEHGIEAVETREELGDLFFQIVFHAQLMEEKGFENLDQLASRCAKKLIERHPHVFAENDQKSTLESVRKNWEQQKKQKSSSTESEAPITEHVAKVPMGLNSILRSQRIGDRAASFGFDWESPVQVLEKIREEYTEFTQEEDEEKMQEELGDLLFSLCQYSRKKRWNLDSILKKSNQKFLKRFRAMELEGRKRSLDLNKATPEEWESLWKKAKESSTQQVK